MTPEQIEVIVQRFLSWRLPADFSPDAGISFKATYNEGTDHPARHEPTGTNLLSHAQASAMFRELLADITPHVSRAAIEAAIIQFAKERGPSINLTYRDRGGTHASGAAENLALRILHLVGR